MKLTPAQKRTLERLHELRGLLKSARALAEFITTTTTGETCSALIGVVPALGELQNKVTAAEEATMGLTQLAEGNAE